MLLPPVVGYGYFLESPIFNLVIVVHSKTVKYLLTTSVNNMVRSRVKARSKILSD